MTNAKRAVTPAQPKWRIEFYPPKRPNSHKSVMVTKCALVYKPQDALVCRHCGFDTPIDDTGLRVIFCGNCGQTMVDYREVDNAEA